MLCHGGLLRKMLFRINISEVMVENTLTKKCTSVSPYFIDFTDTRKPGEALILEAKHIETYYLLNKILIENYGYEQINSNGLVDINNIINKNNIDNDNNCLKLPSNVSNQFGGYQKKYLKYKMKYIQLKTKFNSF